MKVAALELGTKAETLQRLAPRLAGVAVPRLVYWTVGEWRAHRAAILAAVAATFRDARVAVRSATRDEERPGSSLAGRYRTILDVRTEPAALAAAVERVLASYPDREPAHQILVQEMVTEVQRSGVVLTRDPATGAPYVVIELAVGTRTDAVTAGRACPLRVAAHHAADTGAVERAGVGSVVAAARAVAALCPRGAPVEIELAERMDGTLAILQARALRPPAGAHRHRDPRIGASLRGLARAVTRLGCPRPGVAGASTVLGVMPDWNPAELIGAHPAPLAAALFRVLVSDATWQEARAALGYQAVPGTRLVHLLAGRPYVDTRAAFNSWLPAGLPASTRTALVEAWLARLRSRPELHDRVELEVAQTAVDVDTPATYAARFGAPLRSRARDEWLAALRALTARAIDPTPRGSLAAALRRLEAPVSDVPGDDPPLAVTLAALARWRTEGARPFAIVARHAFVAEGFLRSLVGRGALAPERLLALRQSLTTVAGRFAADWARLARGELTLARFLTVYGHLRPGAFDVTSLPYRRRDPVLWEHAPAPPPAAAPFVPSAGERVAIRRLLREAGLARDPEVLLAWAVAAIVGRERAKFLFSRGLSTVLEALADWGARRGLGRDDVAQLTVADLRRASAERSTAADLWARIAAARARRGRERALRLGPLIRDTGDLFVVHELPVLPTFVTDRTVVAPPVHLDGSTLERREVRGRIVCIESADPGFDWLFGRALGGLVTRFGGANSHMAIRCLELGVPAALGVGEGSFERLRAAGMIELCCAERAVRAAESGFACAR